MYLQVICFVLGVCALHTCSVLPDPAHYLLLLPAVLLLRWRTARPLALFACGFFWAGWQAQLLMQDSLGRELQGRTVHVEGTVQTTPERLSAHLQRFRFAIERLDAGEGWSVFTATARLNWYADAAAPQAGERWRLAVRLKQPHGFANPGGFDYEGWLFQQRIRVTGYVRDEPGNTRLEAGRVSGIGAWRVRLLAVFDTLQSHQSTGLVRALTVGERSDIAPWQWNVLNLTGTTHLMAISGLHISLVAGLVFTLVRLLWLRAGSLAMLMPAHRVAALCAIAAAGCYALLSGLGIPARRALVMVAVFMLAVLVNRNVQFPRAIALAMAVTLLVDPLSVLSYGWWLSFWAVIVIAWTGCGRCGQSGFVRRALWMHVVIALAMLPLLLVFFQQASLIAPLANMFAVPLVSLLVVPLALLGAVLITLYEPLGSGLLALAALLLDACWPLLEWLAGLQHAAWTQHQPRSWTLIPAIAGLALLLMPRGLPARSTGLVLLLPLFLVRPSAPGQGEVRFTLLDVGQGLAAVVQTAGHVLVYDTGARFSATFNTGQAVLVPFLRSQGIRRLDMLMVSHGDNDHIGGAHALLQTYPAGHIVTSVPERFPGRRVRPCRDGDQWQWDGVRFTVLHPSARFAGSGNDGSCVLRIEAAGGGRLLLTGDIEQAAEQRLLQERREQLAAGVLVVPHHGSNTSSSDAFIAAVAPTHALFPTGYLNRYRLPKDAVLARYRAAGAQLFETGRHGALSVRFTAHDSSPELAARRGQRMRFWQWSE